MVTEPQKAQSIDRAEAPSEELLNRVFFALSDPVRRAILTRLDEAPLLVSELAAPFDISLQAVSRHIQLLVRAGLVRQERSGRINRCRLEAGPIFSAALWINRYSKYWQAQFDNLAVWLEAVEERNRDGASAPARKRGRIPQRNRNSSNKGKP
ncbi:MAG: ArsR/SmtB family transcription factor [Methyloligellaceae bacterium]